MADKKMILIIEDERDMARLLAVALKNAGYETAVAVDGMTGVQFAHSKKPDLMILDLMLPAGGGYWVLDNLKLSVETWDIPVIVYSAFKDDEHIKKAMEKGAKAYFDKTADMSILLETIKNLLGEQKV